MGYFSIHNHSEFSNIRLLDSTNKVSTLFQRAIDIGLTGFALTDHECLSASVQMVQEYNKLLKAGKITEDFKIALGNEIYLIDDIQDYYKNYTSQTHSYYHFILVAKDAKGFEALKELSSTAWSNSYTQRGMDRVPLSKEQMATIMKKYKGHVIGSTACLGGEIAQHIFKLRAAEKENDVTRIIAIKQKIHDFIMFCQETFGEDNFFLEVQPNSTDEQIYVNKMIMTIAKGYDIKIIYTTDSHYLSKDDRLIHKAFLNAMNGEREVDAFYSTAYMMSQSEVYEYFQEYVSLEEFQEWTDNSNYIRDQIQIYDLYKPQVIPEIEVAEFLKQQAEEDIKPFSHLVQMMEEGCRQDRYWVNTCINALKTKNLFNSVYLQRLDDEAKELLDISKKLDITMSQYYNTMQKIIQIVWDKGNSIVGPARGSATGFLSCYLLEITQVDPIKENLPHWRHLSSTRPELPKSYWVA